MLVIRMKSLCLALKEMNLPLTHLTPIILIIFSCRCSNLLVPTAKKGRLAVGPPASWFTPRFFSGLVGERAIDDG